MIKIAPSLLAADYLNIGNEIRRMADAGADYLHYDVMDGCFVPNITFGPGVAKVAATCGLPVDAHLMIVNPEKYVDAFAEAAVRSSPCTPRPRTTCTGRFNRFAPPGAWPAWR